MNRVVSAVAGLLLCAGSIEAQGVCIANGFGSSCTVAGPNISVRVTPTARVLLASGQVTLTAPNDASFTAGFSTGTPASYEIRANAAWVIAISSPNATWTGSPGSARQNKPQSDLQWSTALNGAYADMTATPTQLATGPATAETILSVFLRSKLNWALDTEGDYQISVELLITAP